MTISPGINCLGSTERIINLYLSIIADPTISLSTRTDDAPDVSLVSGRVRVRAVEEEEKTEGGVSTVALWEAG